MEQPPEMLFAIGNPTLSHAKKIQDGIPQVALRHPSHGAGSGCQADEFTEVMAVISSLPAFWYLHSQAQGAADPWGKWHSASGPGCLVSLQKYFWRMRGCWYCSVGYNRSVYIEPLVRAMLPPVFHILPYHAAMCLPPGSLLATGLNRLFGSGLPHHA